MNTAVMTYWTAFFKTMNREWVGIDYLRFGHSTVHDNLSLATRIDKFLLLISQTLSEIFAYIEVFAVLTSFLG